MNNYQLAYINNTFGKDFAYLYSTDMTKIYNSISIEDNTIIKIIQDKDITIRKYLLVFNSVAFINNILIYYSCDKNTWEEIKPSTLVRDKREFVARSLLIDFENPIKYIKIEDKNNIVDPIILQTVFIEADKDAYYSRIETERRKTLLQTAQIKHATGNSLVNIYFQPCCEEYLYTEIVLYNNDHLLAKYKVSKDEFFLSISGLADGAYYYEVIQYDKSNTVLIKSEKIKFVISPSSMLSPVIKLC